MAGTVKSAAISLGDYKIFPLLLQQRGTLHLIDLNGALIKDVPVFEIDGVKHPRKSHDPVGDSRVVLNKNDLLLQLLVGGPS